MVLRSILAAQCFLREREALGYLSPATKSESSASKSFRCSDTGAVRHEGAEIPAVFFLIGNSLKRNVFRVIIPAPPS